MDTIGRYKTVRPIGSGGMADVWLAQLAQGAATKTVAIKVIAEHLAADAEFRRLFAAEARTSMLMSHSCIAQVFDSGVHEGRSFLVMEWVDGLDLHRVVSAQRLAELSMSHDVAAFITSGILRALSYAHTLTHDGRPLGIVHRDVSPHNLLISASGEVKLVDFGIAALATDRSRQRDVRGKLRYMPPEQLEGRSKDPRVDIFAAGAVLHEMLSGVPFRGEASTADLFEWVAAGRVPKLPKSVPAPLAAVCTKMLARDPNRRYASARDALQDLRAWRNFSGADLETADLCQRIMGIAAPRTGDLPSGTSDMTQGASWEETEAATNITRTAGERPRPAKRRSPWFWAFGGVGALVGFTAVAALVQWRTEVRPSAHSDGGRQAAIRTWATRAPSSPPAPSPARGASHPASTAKPGAPTQSSEAKIAGAQSPTSKPNEATDQSPAGDGSEPLPRAEPEPTEASVPETESKESVDTQSADPTTPATAVVGNDKDVSPPSLAAPRTSKRKHQRKPPKAPPVEPPPPPAPRPSLPFEPAARR